MKTGILEGSANDRPNYDVTCDKCRCAYRLPADRVVCTGSQNRYTGISCKKTQMHLLHYETGTSDFWVFKNW